MPEAKQSSTRMAKFRYPHPRCFLKRGCKRLKTKETGVERNAETRTKRLQGDANKRAGTLEGTESFHENRRTPPHPRGNADQCENKRLAEKAIRKSMKTSGAMKRE
jgi:hypothetical protein